MRRTSEPSSANVVSRGRAKAYCFQPYVILAKNARRMFLKGRNDGILPFYYKLHYYACGRLL